MIEISGLFIILFDGKKVFFPPGVTADLNIIYLFVKMVFQIYRNGQPERAVWAFDSVAVDEAVLLELDIIKNDKNIT